MKVEDVVKNRTLVLWLALLLAVDGCSRLLPAAAIEMHGIYLWAGYLVLGCVLLGKRLGAFVFVSLLAIALLLDFASGLKIQLTQMPITVDDILITAMYPEGLWESIGASLPMRLLAYLVLALLVATLAFLVAGTLLEVKRRPDRSSLLVRGLLFAALFGFSLAGFSQRQFTVVNLGETGAQIWSPDGEAKFAERIGFVSYINYTLHKLLANGRGEIFDSAVASRGSAHAGAPVAPSLFSRTASGGSPAPNIVFMLLESTFDIEKSFVLSSPMGERLFSANKYTKLLSPFRVNAVGGGTWVTEFETIVGIDSRMFGYYGGYTHSTVSPLIRHSFATYLSGKGYSTTAVYPVSGVFFNARNAYRNYGFQRFFDADDLALHSGWGVIRDPEIVERAKGVLAKSSQPFFAYVLTVENHAPHNCADPAAQNGPGLHLAHAPDFAGNCAIGVYRDRLKSTSTAVFSMLTYLERLERESGRPFVLAVFGDHQPHTFTSKGGMQHDFSPYRTSAPKNETIVHVMSSLPGTFDCCKSAAPAFVLPTLVSNMFSDEPSDSYLPLNTALFDACGSDAVGAYRTRAEPATAQRCQVAYASAVDAYRRDIVRNDVQP